MSPDCLILCDRGSLHGLAYWPGSDQAFFKTMNTSLQDELARYNAVILFETAAKSGQEVKIIRAIMELASRDYDI